MPAEPSPPSRPALGAHTPGAAGIDAARRLLEVLARERDALMRPTAGDDLAETVRAKQALLDELAVLTRAPGTVAALAPELHALLAECRRGNERNGALLAARLHHARRSLAILRGEPADAGLYDPRGASTPGALGQRSLAKA
jgi:flagellar biosynthesis/type III secretory pathway chaperone